MIQERSDIVFDQIYPKIEALGIRESVKFNISDLEKDLVPDLTNKLKTLTTAIIELVEKTLNLLKYRIPSFNQ
jgi:hypothetical protein